MFIKIVLAVLALSVTLTSIFINNKSYYKYIIASIGFLFFCFTIWDIYDTSKKDAANQIAITSLDKTVQQIRGENNISFAKLGVALKPYNLKISGDTVALINPTFVDNHSINVTSNDQKGGQTAGSIINH